MRLLLGVSLIIMSACTTADAKRAIEIGVLDTSTDHIQSGPYSSSAWISDGFTGEKSRRFDGNALSFAVTQTAAEGGLDVGLSWADDEPGPVSIAAKDIVFCSTYRVELSGEGRWWAGPKISVNWQGDEAAKQNGDDWYENYIIEVASTSPDELHEILTDDYFQAEELPSTQLAGATYRHYKLRFHSWWQFWSIRQNYRTSGALPIEPIVDVWIKHGLPTERTFDGVKANIETYGPITGIGRLALNTSEVSPAADKCRE